MFQNLNRSLSTLFLRLLAGLLLTISMTKQAITAINASAFRLVITTHGSVPKITFAIFGTLLSIDKGVLALVASLALQTC